MMDHPASQFVQIGEGDFVIFQVFQPPGSLVGHGACSVDFTVLINIRLPRLQRAQQDVLLVAYTTPTRAGFLSSNSGSSVRPGGARDRLMSRMEKSPPA